MLPLVSICGTAGSMVPLQQTSLLSFSPRVLGIQSTPASLLLLWVRQDKNQSHRQAYEKPKSICMLYSFLSFSKKLPWLGHILPIILSHTHSLSAALQACWYHSKLCPLSLVFSGPQAARLASFISAPNQAHTKNSPSGNPPKNQSIIHCSTLSFLPREKPLATLFSCRQLLHCVRLGVGWSRLERKDSSCFSVSVLGFSHTWDTASSYMTWRMQFSYRYFGSHIVVSWCLCGETKPKTF